MNDTDRQTLNDIVFTIFRYCVNKYSKPQKPVNEFNFVNRSYSIAELFTESGYIMQAKSCLNCIYYSPSEFTTKENPYRLAHCTEPRNKNTAWLSVDAWLSVALHWHNCGPELKWYERKPREIDFNFEENPPPAHNWIGE